MDILTILKKSKVQEPFTETTFECKRGELTIRGTEYRPEGENLPVAIVSHGFMAWQDTVRHYAKELARMGYCAYCFDFCGGSVMKKGKSDGETTDMSVLTEVQDLEAVIGCVQSLPYNSKELLLMGCSQGGFVSALVAAKHPELVNKLVLFYPALCIPDDARAGKMKETRLGTRGKLSATSREYEDKELILEFDRSSKRWGLVGSVDDEEVEPPDPLLLAISEFIGKVGNWKGTATELLEHLKGINGKIQNPPNALARYLNANSKQLRERYGVEYAPRRERNVKYICLEPVCDNSDTSDVSEGASNTENTALIGQSA